MPSRTLSPVHACPRAQLFDWHSVGLFYSFEYAGQHGNITRLLACSEEEQKAYPAASLAIGPTFVHRNMRNDPLVDEEGAWAWEAGSIRGYFSSERVKEGKCRLSLS